MTLWKTLVSVIAVCLCVSVLSAGAASPWGADYFPNVPLMTSEGESVRFFDDLIKDKVVAINFIYTSCPDTCPLETAQLVKVQNIMGARLGQDVFFYSITIDPDNDSVEVLAEYKRRFGANWTFLTGKQEDITQLRRKLGLYIEEIQDGSNNHNVSMIIGNQATGRWMKRSPFENPYVLADQLGNWLSGWKSPPQNRNYANAPKLRSIPPGEQLFRTRCASCHTINGNESENALGPDLMGVVQQRDMNWLINWLRAPDQMLANEDPIAISLFEEYDRLPMPNMRLNQQETTDLLTYIDEETKRIFRSAGGSAGSSSGVLGISGAWVREAHPDAKANAGYMTMINAGPEQVTLVKIESDSFAEIEVHEMVHVDGLMQMRRVTNVAIPPNESVQLSPGGKHLMMIDPQTHIVTGHTVDMTLTFRSGRTQSLSIEVASR